MHVQATAAVILTPKHLLSHDTSLQIQLFSILTVLFPPEFPFDLSLKAVLRNSF